MIGRRVASLVLIFAGAFSACAAEEPNPWEKLKLNSTQIAGSRVFYEQCFEQKLPAFRRPYNHFLAAKQTDKIQLFDIAKIVADINRILGETKPDTKAQSEMLDYYLRLFWNTKFTFYLVRKRTIKDFLRAGGQLPRFSYDSETDSAQYRLEVITTGKSKPAEELEIPFAMSSEVSFEQDVNDGFEAIRSLIYGARCLGTGIHEVTELGLLRRARPNDQYWRWFSDGFANAVTIELLNRHIGKEAAEQFAAPYDVRGYIDLLREINLAYWMSTKYNIETPLDYEKQLDYARYCFATLEARRLIEKHGIGCVRRILDRVVSQDSRTSKGLLDVIKQVTGEDMTKRLAKYQAFSTVKKGTLKYLMAFEAASVKKDYEQMLINHLRLMEVVQDSPFSFNSLKNYRKAALLLFRLGREEAGDKVMHKCLELFEESHVPNAYYAALEQVAVYALECDKPAKAKSAANELLRSDPNNVPCLSVKMLVLARSGRLTEAKETAVKIQKLVGSKASKAGKAAAEILAIDPNEQQKEK